MRSAHLTNVRSVASWSGISCRWPRPCRVYAVAPGRSGTAPVRSHPNAVASAAAVFSTPGTGHHAEHAGPAGGTRIAEGHVAAGLLVAGADQPSAAPAEGVEQAVDLRAGQAEHGSTPCATRPETMASPPELTVIAISLRSRAKSWGLVCHAVAQHADILGLDLGAIARLQIARRMNRAPAPVGVPVTMTSPGTSVVKVEI